MAWDRKTLEECTEYITDGDHQPAPKSDDGVLFIKIKDIKDSRVDFKEALHVPLVYYEGIQRNRKPVLGDTLYTVVGSYGLSAYVNFDIPFCFERNIALLHPKKGVDSRFLFYSVNTPDFFKQAENAANGAAQKLIPLSRLKQLKIQVPPFATQQKIAGILSAYDDLIENNQKQIKLLEEAAQRLYKQWFIDLRYPGHETTKIVDGFPEGWKKEKLVDLADVVMGQSPKSEFYNQEKKGLPFHQGVGSYGTRFVIDETYTSSITRIAEAGSILFSVRAPVGRLNFTKNKIVIGRGLAAINHKAKCQSFLFYMLKDRFFKDDILGNGAIFASISKDELLNQKFVIPSRELMSKFNTIASGIDAKIAAADAQMQLLTQSRDRLLPKLMNGELEV